MKRKLLSDLDRDMVISHIKRLDLKKLYTVEVTEKNYKRSISQNSLYWLWLTCIEQETGNNRDDLHDIFKHKFIIPTEVYIFGERITKWTTTDKDTAQFKQYLDKIQIFCSAELAIDLPNPDDRRFEEFYKSYIDKL